MLKRKTLFYSIILGLTILDSFLLSKPNLLGKIGLFIYKYHYLRTFPRTLLTVSIVMAVTIAIAELIRMLVKRQTLKRMTGLIILSLLIFVAAAALIKTGMDFSTWTYSHTGHRFKYGAYLLPLMLVAIFVHAIVKLPKILELPVADMVKNNQTSSDVDDKS
jgi:succinate dehydrogenase hydrophobic anchor subunit